METLGNNGDRPNVQRLTNLLVHSIRYAVEQQKTATAMRSLALTDELTRLCNRRGFLALAEQQLKLANRTGRRVLLFLADVDGLKQINDTFGHREGDRVLREAAEVLKMTFRDSDIIARLGGDEFVVLANEAPDESEEIITARLHENLRTRNQKEPPFVLSISVGVVPFIPSRACSVEDLVARADKAMYAQKRSQRHSSPEVQGNPDGESPQETKQETEVRGS